MMRACTRLLLFSILFLCFSCGPSNEKRSADRLNQKAAPSDQFSFQRSFPDRDFDWKGWQKRLSILQTDFAKSMQQQALPENGSAPDWTLQGPGNVGGRVNTLAIHPTNENIVLAGFSAGGIFKSTDGGVNWSPVFDNHLELSIGHIIYDPNNPNIVYAGTGDPNMPAIVFNGHGVYKSTDGGENWNYLGLSQAGIISKLAIDPSNSNTLYASTMGNPYIRDVHRGVYKSTDGGISWQNVLFVSDQAGSSDLIINPSNPQILYASFWDRIRNNQESVIYGPHARIYKSTDGGANWTQLSGGLPTGVMGRTGLAMSKQNPDKLYAVYIDSLSTTGGLYKTVDGGTSWTSVNVNALEDACGNFGWYFGKIRVSPVNDEEVYFLGVILWRKDAGSTQWQVAANSHADCHDLQFAATGKRYLGCDGGVYRNTPGLMQWSKSNNLPTTQFYHTSYNPHEPNTYYGGAQDNGIRRGSGALYNGWESIFPADGFRCAFHPNDPNTFWVETQNGAIHKTTDGGVSWQQGQDCLGTSDRCNWDMPYFRSIHGTTRLFAATYRVYFSDNGSGWGTISGDLTDGVIFEPRYHTISCLDESPVLPEKLFAGTSDGNVWRREPTGAWTNISSGLPDRYVTSVSGSPSLANRIFVTNSGFRDNEYIPHIHRSDNNGANWTDISGNLPNVPVNDLLVLPGHADSVLFAATDAGVYASFNNGQQWQRLGNKLPFVPVFDLERNPVRNELMAASYARGLYTFPLDSIFNLPPATSVAVSGQIRTEAGVGVGLVEVCDQPVQITSSSGSFEILSDAECLLNGLYPTRNDNHLNGVSTFDLVLINKHILGITALDSPYKIIAADANNSRSISTFDIVSLRKLILGIDTVLGNVNSWRFIPSDYTFPDTLNPFATVFPEGVDLNISAPPTTANFIGVKVGDVNGNAISEWSSPDSQVRDREQWQLLAEDKFFEANEPVRVRFSAKWADLAGAQLTLKYASEIVDLQSVEPIAPGLSAQNFALNPRGKSCLTVSLENPETIFSSSPAKGDKSETVLFEVLFRSKSPGRIQEILQLAAVPTPAMAFRTDGQVLTPTLNWISKTIRSSSAWSVYPNPIQSEGVTFQQEQADGKTPVVLRIFTANGSLIVQKTSASGLIHISADQFPNNGVYWYELQYGATRQNGKLVKTAP